MQQPNTGPTDSELETIKKKLKAGKIDQSDLKTLEALVERTEQATKALRAPVVK